MYASGRDSFGRDFHVSLHASGECRVTVEKPQRFKDLHDYYKGLRWYGMELSGAEGFVVSVLFKVNIPLDGLPPTTSKDSHKVCWKEAPKGAAVASYVVYRHEQAWPDHLPLSVPDAVGFEILARWETRPGHWFAVALHWLPKHKVRVPRQFVDEIIEYLNEQPAEKVQNFTCVLDGRSDEQNGHWYWFYYIHGPMVAKMANWTEQARAQGGDIKDPLELRFS